MRHFQVHVTYKTSDYKSQTLLGFIRNEEPTKEDIEKALKEQQGVDNLISMNYTIKTLS